MGNVIKVDFQKDRRREVEAFVKFEKAMNDYHRKQRLRLMFLLIGFTSLIIFIMAIPFLIDLLVRP